ncbi:hypothetical protein B0H63DRAFT_484273 [Podospora didyma]|uniref:Uncharacterized protein n=1 Tax=Podospora didyma TaxID=330526 RepID=A0AAE0K8Z0_9PEZI|nr:hypothetical protein B0H63DRAFT_484273 [Podospora didyma]
MPDTSTSLTAAVVPSPSTGQVLLTRAWLFQLLIAGPTFLTLGWGVWESYFYTWSSIYTLVAYLFNTFFSAGIVFIVLVQRKLPDASVRLTSNFEVVKSLLATIMWIWLVCDAIWHPRHYPYYPPDYDKDMQARRIVISILSIFVLLIFFYPSSLYTSYLAGHEDDPQPSSSSPGSPRRSGNGGRQQGGNGASEQTPLLGDEAV